MKKTAFILLLIILNLLFFSCLTTNTAAVDPVEVFGAQGRDFPPGRLFRITVSSSGTLFAGQEEQAIRDEINKKGNELGFEFAWILDKASGGSYYAGGATTTYNKYTNTSQTNINRYYEGSGAALVVFIHEEEIADYMQQLQRIQ